MAVWRNSTIQGWSIVVRARLTLRVGQTASKSKRSQYVEAVEESDGSYRCSVRSTRQSATGSTLKADHFTGTILLQAEDEIEDPARLYLRSLCP